MKVSDIAVPEIYKSSADFRFFLKWIELAMERPRHDTENIVDLYDPLRCPEHLLWMLGDTVGYKYDDRLPAAFNRLVLLYFMSMIRHKGSKDGVTLAAEVNLAQFNILEYGKKSDILHNRLEDTSIPVNSVYVTSHPDEGYIDVVYFSEKKPTDACLEYVRPLGMYLFEYAGVRYDGRTKISVDARLTNSNELNTSVGPTRVGHYRRDDYARLQKTKQQTTFDHVDEAGNVSWEASFSQIGDTWILAKTPKVTRDQITVKDAGAVVESEDSDGFVWTTNANAVVYSLTLKNSIWNFTDSNGQVVNCNADDSIGSVGSGWSITQVPEDVGKFYIKTADNKFRLASNLAESGKFRGYSDETIRTSDAGVFSIKFNLFKYNDVDKAFVLVTDDRSLVPGQYVIMTSEYAMGVLDNSGVIVGTGKGTASVVAVQARDTQTQDYTHRRNRAYYRNSDSEQLTGATIDAGYRALYALQLCNNEHVVKANMPTIFGLADRPTDLASGSLKIATHEPVAATKRITGADLFDRVPLPWNLGYDKIEDESVTYRRDSLDKQSKMYDVATVRGGTPEAPVPAVNPAMYSLGDAISLGQYNTGDQEQPAGYNKYYTTTDWIRDTEGNLEPEIQVVDPKDTEDT